jgi:phosphoribosylformylglycinamidine synthase
MQGHLGQSALLAEGFGVEAGDAPPVDLAAERRNGEFVLANRRLIRACTDLSDGGLALAAFEMAAGAGVGVILTESDVARLFGEDQARYLAAAAPADAERLAAAAEAAEVPFAVVGRFGTGRVALGGSWAQLADLSALWRDAFAETVG